MLRRRTLGVLAGLAGAGLVGAACSSSPSIPANLGPQNFGGTTTTVRNPGPNQATGSTTSTTAAAATTTTAAGPAPTLGIASAWTRVGPSVVGFGQVRPAEISLGGDPTGVLSGIIWQSWGGATATGTGTSTYVPPGATTAQGSQQHATVEAFDLGTCGGVPAYLEVKWYFPQEGESLTTGANAVIHACSGP